MPGAQPREQGVALGERLRVRAARRRARRPQRGDEGVEVRAAQRGRALHELEAVGQEDAHKRAHRRVEQALDRRAVDLQALGLPRREADAQLVLAVAVAPADLHARGARVEAHDLALVRRPARAPGAAEVQGLEEVRLARAVRAVDDRQPLAERDVGARVGAEVAQPEAGDEHRQAAGAGGCES